MYNGYNNAFSNNKEINSIQQLPNDDLFISNSIQIPKQFSKFLEEASSSNEDEPDASVIHSISSDNDENSHSSSEKEKKEIDSIFDFENIELPREEEHGDFTILSDFKIESLDSKDKNEKNKKNKKNEIIQKKGKKDKNDKNVKKEPKGQKNKNVKIIKEKIEEESEEDEDDKEMELEAWDLLKLLILTKSKKKTSFMGNFKHFISTIIYNYKSFNAKLNKTNIKYPVNIFDRKANNIFLDINYSSSSFLYMSYRSGFFNMKYFDMGDFTSDSGWGCMLRCCQMMLSRGLVKIKLKEYYKNNEKSIISNQIPKNVILDIKKDILTLFYDGKLLYNKIRSNLFLAHFFQLYQELADIKGISTNISEMIPPYSIYTLCYLGKCQGIYTSDVRMIKCFVKINELLFDSFNMVHFENGHVQKSTLFENFVFLKDEIDNIENKNQKEIYKYYGREFIFNQSGLVFISFRLGLQKLDESYYNIIPLIFSKIHNNIGFVSGKKNRAYYFVGCNGDGQLIFADPHFNQKVEEYNENLISYNIPELYLLNRSELSGELTLGIFIYDLNDFKTLVEDLEYLTNTFPNFITFK